MECALCKNTILMEVQGFSQLPCKHTFHLRCMVPACNQFWSEGPIGCKICGTDIVVPANDTAEQPGIQQAQAIIRQREVTVDDAYGIVAGIEEKNYKSKIAEHVKTLTPEQKADLKMFVKSVRLGKKLRVRVRSELNKRVSEFNKKNNHLIVVFNKLYRKLVKDFIETDVCKLYWKTYQKNTKLHDKLTNQVTNNKKYEIEDLCLALKYSRVPIYLCNEMPLKRVIRYRFYKVIDMLFNIKNLDKPIY